MDYDQTTKTAPYLVAHQNPAAAFNLTNRHFFFSFKFFFLYNI